MQIGEKIFRQMKQKTLAILDVLTSIFVRYDGKYSVKMRACDLISGYLRGSRYALKLTVIVFAALGSHNDS